MLWKCYTQYTSKFGELSTGHRTGKGQFSSQSQRKARPKNALLLLLLLNRFSHVHLYATPQTAAHQALVPGILQARILVWVAISFSNAWKWKVKGKSLSHVQLLVTPWTPAYQAPPPMGHQCLLRWPTLTGYKKQRHNFANKGPSSQSFGFSSSHIWMWELDYKESWALRTDAFELWCWRRFLRVPWTGRRSNQFILKEISPEYHWNDWCWSWNSNTLATWCEEMTHWKGLWCSARLKAGGEGEDRGWDGWIVSLTQWTGVWVSSGSWWWIGKPGVLQSLRLQRVRNDWVIALNWMFESNLSRLSKQYLHHEGLILNLARRYRLVKRIFSSLKG